MDIKARQDALTTVGEERDSEQRRAEKAEEKAEMMDGQIEVMAKETSQLQVMLQHMEEASKVRFDSKEIDPV